MPKHADDPSEKVGGYIYIYIYVIIIIIIIIFKLKCLKHRVQQGQET